LKLDFSKTAEPIARLVEELSKLPGIGPKSAQRLTYYLLQSPPEKTEALAKALLNLKQNLKLCSVCFNITDLDPCALCSDQERDHNRICIVEEPADILALERTKKYNGLYHVLHGVISPADGVGPDELKIADLLERLKNNSISEVILATNPNTEGEATAMYLYSIISPMGISVTRLARGLPYGGDLEYADDVTLSRALEGRQQI